MQFNEFIDRKSRESKRQLNLIKKVLESEGMPVKDFLNDDEPFIFVGSPGDRVSFGGVRVYKVLDALGFRVQKEDKTHPYGKAYTLAIEQMYDDCLADKMEEKKAAKEVAKAVVKELREFFRKSAEAEKELRQGEFDTQGDPLGKVMVKTTGTDYSNTLHNKTNY